MSNKTHVVFIGNPGTGKSTILNSIVGESVFRSGVKFGSGLTERLQLHTHGSIVYCDTPGLDDIKKAEQAALEVEKGLKQGGTYKIIFVQTVEAGRIRATDQATKNAVLDALKQIPGREYGVILNKLSPSIQTSLTEEEVAEYLNTGIRVPLSSFHLIPNIQAIADAPNAVLDQDCTANIVSWISTLPSIQIQPEQVLKVTLPPEELKKVQAELIASNKKVKELESRPPRIVHVHHHHSSRGFVRRGTLPAISACWKQVGKWHWQGGV